MFDVGFTELVLVAFVALLVLGPDKLPAAARTAGLWVGRLKRSFNTIKQDFEREVGADEIRRQLRSDQLLDLKREVQEHVQPSVDRGREMASSASETLNAALDPTPKPDVAVAKPQESDDTNPPAPRHP